MEKILSFLFARSPLTGLVIFTKPYNLFTGNWETAQFICGAPRAASLQFQMPDLNTILGFICLEN
jgi:hypothetical protein